MMLDTETDAASEQNQEEVQGDQNSELKSEIENLKNQNTELLQKMNSFFAAQNQPKTENKPLSTEEFKELLSKDPEKAIQYALADKVNSQTTQIAKSLTSQQQQTYYDQKAEQDFPLITKDKQFQKLVKDETKSLIEDGMSRESPKLVYKAAQIAALKYKGAQETKVSESNSGSGEAPSNGVKKGEPSKALPKNFDKMASMFNLSDKAKKRAEENFAFKAKQEAHRKGR